jgi:hypothetical protein
MNNKLRRPFALRANKNTSASADVLRKTPGEGLAQYGSGPRNTAKNTPQPHPAANDLTND